MTILNELATLLQPNERIRGGCGVARLVGGTHLCVFIRDPELNKFLPAPGFPQKMPNGIRWSQFLKSIAESGASEAQMKSPFSLCQQAVSGFRLDENAIAVLFGEDLQSGAIDALVPGLRILAALFGQEVKTHLAQSRASFSHRTALESKRLASALSDAHDMLTAALVTRESLLTDIRRNDERLQMVRRMSGIGTWEFDATTQRVHLSAETSAIHGLPAEEFKGEIHEVFSRVHQDDQERIRAILDAALANTGDYNAQFRIVWPNGVVRWVEDRGTVLRDMGADKLMMIGFSLDITQRMMTEETLIRSEKLAAAGRLSASIAHEINNPLEAIVNLIYLARNDSDLARIRELLTLADDELVRISNVARQALGFYRDVNTPVRFGITALIKQVLELFNKQTRDKDVSLKSEFPMHDIEMEGSPGEIRQALLNLLINSVQASACTASIRIRVRVLGNWIYLTIADKGSGISREHLHHIFEPFFSTKKNSGTGLGLWLTNQIVQKHGGSIRVRSSNGTEQHGTVMRLSLPAAEIANRFNGSEQHLKYRSL